MIARLMDADLERRAGRIMGAVAQHVRVVAVEIGREAEQMRLQMDGGIGRG